MQKIFCYLDKYHVRNRQVESLFQFGLTIFKKQIYDKISKELVNSAIDQIQKERNKDMVDRAQIKKVLQCITQMGLKNPEIMKVKENNSDRLLWKGESDNAHYTNDFEKKFLDTTKRHYKMLSEQ